MDFWVFNGAFLHNMEEKSTLVDFFPYNVEKYLNYIKFGAVHKRRHQFLNPLAPSSSLLLKAPFTIQQSQLASLGHRNSWEMSSKK